MVYKNQFFTRITTILMCVIAGIFLFPTPAAADMGPKPSVQVTFKNLGDSLCYATLLSSTHTTGPYTVWDGEEENQRHNENKQNDYSYLSYGYDVWKAFVDYEDKDGFYFLQIVWQVNETKEFAWTYYPPSEFKVLLYFPETGEFAVSDVNKRYAFDSYFTVEMDGAKLFVDYDEELSSDKRLVAYKTYNIRVELGSLAARIVLTILIEMLIAVLFGYRRKKQLLLLAGVNSATQIILNVLLNIVNHNSDIIVVYILCEVLVFAIEAALYYSLLEKWSTKKRSKWLAVIYALVANVASFGAGLVIAQWLPGIF